MATVEAAERALLASQAAQAASSSSADIAPDEVEKPKRPGNTIYSQPDTKTDAQLNAEEQEKRRVRIEAETVDQEHMQLTPEEVWFLAWGLDCLTVLDAKTVSPVLQYSRIYQIQQRSCTQTLAASSS